MNDKPQILHRYAGAVLFEGEAGMTTRQMLEKAQAAFGNEYSRDEIISRMRALFKRFFASQFKRNCLPDGPMALGVSLSPRGGFSLASDASARAWLDAVDRLTQA